MYVCILKFYLFIFRERGREGERKGEKINVVASHVLPTGDLVCNPGRYPDREPNRRPFGLQAYAQSTELHQPGLIKHTMHLVKQFPSKMFMTENVSRPGNINLDSKRLRKGNSKEIHLSCK